MFAGRAIPSYLALAHILWHRKQLRADKKKDVKTKWRIL
jgi:hypothetical protein